MKKRTGLAPFVFIAMWISVFALGIVAEANAPVMTFVSRMENDKTVNQFVYVTENGKKYHIDGCYTIKDSTSVREISRTEAEEKGYSPCGICNK